MNFVSEIEKVDPEISSAIEGEVRRQREQIELIASENFVSRAVMAAMGTPLTNKYAEGYPSKRYYAGCEYVDVVERLAIERAQMLFGAEYVNVQPHSGAQANMAVFYAALEPGDTYLGMSLAHGGHLSHGSPANISGKYYNVVPYGVDSATQTINYDSVHELAVKHKPKLILAGASAYARKIDFEKFKEISDSVGAYLMVDMAHIAGLVAAGLHQNPVPYADFVTTTTHKTLRGPRGGMILAKEKYSNIINKSVFPGIQGGPLMHVIAAKAVCFLEAMSNEFKAYQSQIVLNASALAQALIERGMSVVSGGTDNHLMLLDLRNRNITGKQAETILDEMLITVNKNTIPDDPESPFVTSGIRLGVPAVTSRGMNVKDMVEIAELINLTLLCLESSKSEIKTRAKTLLLKYPLYV